MLAKDLISILKLNEEPELIVPLLTDIDLQAFVGAWPSLCIQPVRPEMELPQKNQIDILWSSIRYHKTLFQQPSKSEAVFQRARDLKLI